MSDLSGDMIKALVMIYWLGTHARSYINGNTMTALHRRGLITEKPQPELTADGLQTVRELLTKP